MHQQNMNDMTGQPDGLDLDESSDWLHTNDSYVQGNPRHEGTASTPIVLSQDHAADGDSIPVLTNADSQDVPEYQNSMETNSSRAPFGDLTNQTNGGVESESNLQSANNSAEQRKRERERTRYAVFSQEEKNARCMRQREVRRKKKGARCISFLWCYNITCNLDGSIFQGCIKLLDLLILRSALEH
ncbi:hypothetical protein PVAP13_1KG064800 [Panicum virgatum]|uniref:Uncharacterized protein n=1 Tax=Panicum virgatum TaxID=38727 RepID=A0A8T0X3P1_PANVG|nr:hypothetical protein PVAP13_1KG064800 [Panicum virgatum]